MSASVGQSLDKTFYPFPRIAKDCQLEVMKFLSFEGIIAMSITSKANKGLCMTKQIWICKVRELGYEVEKGEDARTKLIQIVQTQIKPALRLLNTLPCCGLKIHSTRKEIGSVIARHRDSFPFIEGASCMLNGTYDQHIRGNGVISAVCSRNERAVALLLQADIPIYFINRALEESYGLAKTRAMLLSFKASNPQYANYDRSAAVLKLAERCSDKFLNPDMRPIDESCLSYETCLMDVLPRVRLDPHHLESIIFEVIAAGHSLALDHLLSNYPLSVEQRSKLISYLKPIEFSDRRPLTWRLAASGPISLSASLQIKASKAADSVKALIKR